MRLLDIMYYCTLTFLYICILKYTFSHERISIFSLTFTKTEKSLSILQSFIFRWSVILSVKNLSACQTVSPITSADLLQTSLTYCPMFCLIPIRNTVSLSEGQQQYLTDTNPSFLEHQSPWEHKEHKEIIIWNHVFFLNTSTILYLIFPNSLEKKISQ